MDERKKPGEAMEEGGIKMEDDEILQLYWDRDEQAIPATAEK